jgi:A/G-specific adenine glycosylase
MALREAAGQGYDIGQKTIRRMLIPSSSFSLTGLLAGLFEPPSMIVDSVISTGERIEKLCVYASSLFDAPQEVSTAMDAVKKMQDHGYLQDYVHVFSHIRMTYHVHRLLLHTPTLPQRSSFETETTWMNMDEIAAANVTTGAKNILKALYDPPQLQDAKKKPVARKAKPTAVSVEAGKKVVKVIKMPGT